MGIENLPVLTEPLEFPMLVIESALIKHKRSKELPATVYVFGKIMKGTSTFLVYDNAYELDENKRPVILDDEHYFEVNLRDLRGYRTKEVFVKKEGKKTN